MRILIATPTAGGITTTAYTQSVVAATVAIHEMGGSYRHLSIDGADVVIARNILAHSFLTDDSCDHILFIDSDMAVDLAVFRRLLKARTPLIGAAYSERRLNLPVFAAAMAEDDNEARARALASNFTVRMKPGEKKISGGICPVDALGFGCVLIHRDVFQSLIDRQIVGPFISSKLKDLGLEGTVYDFFDEIPLENGDWLSEDYSFCQRVRQLGYVDILAYVGAGVGHVGPFTYSGPYIEKLKAGKL